MALKVWSAGEKLNADDLNNNFGLGSSVIDSLLAGENLSGATLPVPCYIKKSDSKVYQCDDTDVEKVDFKGFAVSTALADELVELRVSGILEGLSGLVVGTDYYYGGGGFSDVITQSSGNNDDLIGWNADNTKKGQTFLWNEDPSYPNFKSLKLYLKKVGGPTDNLVVRIYASDKSTLLATSDVISGSTLTTSEAEYEFTFPTPPTLIDATEYFWEIERSGSLNTSNYYTIRYQSTNVYGDGARYKFEGGSWAVQGDDMKFVVVAELPTPNEYMTPVVSNSEIYLGRAITTTELLILNKQDQFIGTETLVKNNSYTVPSSCNKIIITSKVGNGGTTFERTDIVLTKNGKKSADHEFSPSGTNYNTNYDWTGDSLSVSNDDLMSGVAYYLR